MIRRNYIDIAGHEAETWLPTSCHERKSGTFPRLSERPT